MPADTSHPALEALTRQAEAAIGAASLTIAVSPFRFGRESRGTEKKRLHNRRLFTARPINECFLTDSENFRQISRAHFLIQQAEDGSWELVDRGSTCGTWVNDIRLYEDPRPHRVKNGDVIVVGTAESPYRFRFVDSKNRDDDDWQNAHS